LENINSSGALDLTFTCGCAVGKLANVKSAPLGSVAERFVRARPLKACHRLFMEAGAVCREAAEDHARQRRCRWQRFGYPRNRDARGAIGRKAVDAGRDRRKSHRSKVM